MNHVHQHSVGRGAAAAATGLAIATGLAVAFIAIIADRLISAGAARTRARLGLA